MAGLPPDGTLPSQNVDHPFSVKNIGKFLQEGLQGVLDSTKRGQELRAQKFKEGLDRDKLNAERENQEALIKFHHDSLDEQKRQHDIAEKAAAAVREVQLIHAKQGITEGILKGVPVPGETVTQGVGNPNESAGGFSPINPQQATTETHNLPNNLGSVTVDNSTTRANKQADLERITDAPKVEADIKKQKALLGEQMLRDAANKQADLDRVQAQKQYDDARMVESKKADDARADKHNAVLKDIARINATAKGTANQLPENFDLDDFTAKVINGDVSKEEIPKLIGKQSGNVQLLLGKNGVKALSKDQVSLVGEFKQLVDSVQLMDQIIANQPQTTNRLSSHIAGPISRMTNTNLSAPEQELAGRLSVISRNLMKEKGALSNKDIERATNMMPNSSEPVQVNVKKRNDYVKELTNVIDAKLSDIPEKQRTIIKKKLGLFDIPMSGGTDKKTRPPLSSYQVNQ